MSKRIFRKGDLVRHLVSKNVGIVLAVVKRERTQVSLWVLVEGERKRWPTNGSVAHVYEDRDFF